MKRLLIPQLDGTCLVPLANNRGFAVIDAADAEVVGKYNWFLMRIRRFRTLYATTHAHDQGVRKTLSLHRLLAGEDGLEVDHVDGDGLNNRRENLRVATPGQNRHNQRLSRANTSGYKGVYWHKNEQKWCARVRHGGRSYHLGYFLTSLEAASAYDNAARRLHGDFASLNLKSAQDLHT